MPFKSEKQRKYLWANEPEIARDWTDTYGSGIQAAQGGMIGSVGGISRPKYQQGNMVGAEMEGAEIEGAEMEGAMMQSQEVIKELYDALIAQGLSPQEAMKQIKELLAATQAEEPQSPMMGEEFPGQEFSRTPAAGGGIMGSNSGSMLVAPTADGSRPGYGFPNPFKVVKKALKKVKKLASSKLGKLALMYAAGTYLGGMQAFGGPQGGMGWKKFGTRLLNPMSTEGGISNVGRKALSYFKTPTPKVASYADDFVTHGKALAGTGELTGGSRILPNAYKLAEMTDWEKAASLAKLGTGEASKSFIPGVSNKVLAGVAGPSIAAGLYTAAQPPETLGGEVQGEYDEDLQKWKDYYAGLGSDYSVNPDRLKSAQGGRIGRQEGGLMNLGGMEKDYRNDGGFVPLGGEEKADDVPARLSKNEFVFTADAVRNAGGGDIDRGAEVMENVMKNLEGGGQISEESQGQGAQEMFETSERLSEVI